MARKPIYKELEQKVKELEKEAGRRNWVQEELKTERTRLFALLNGLPAYVYLQAPDHSIRFANSCFRERFGEPEGKPCYQVITGRDKPCKSCRPFSVFETGRPIEWEWVRGDGKTYQIYDYPFSDIDGSPLVLELGIDITERKHAEQALRESEAQKKAILDASIDRIRYIDKDMKIIWANKTTAEAANMSPEDLVGQLCFRLFVGRDTPCKECPTKKSQETGQLERAVIRHPRVKGIEEESYWDNYSVPIKNEAGDIVSFIQIARNITDQKRAEERVRTLTHELIKAQERERQKISCELHDRVAQDLSTAKMFCEMLFVNQPTVPREIRHRVSELSKILQGSIAAVRDLAYDLRPSDLDQLGLVQAAFQYCKDFSEKTGLSVDFSSAGMDDLKMDSDTEINLYRVVQEGLNNVKKHAEATRSTVKLVSSLPNIILRIEDNGKGFDAKERWVTASQKKRMGLTSMEERVSLLGGTMTIQSSPMRGTNIFVEVPYERKKD